MLTWEQDVQYQKASNYWIVKRSEHCLAKKVAVVPRSTSTSIKTRFQGSDVAACNHTFPDSSAVGDIIGESECAISEWVK